MSKRKERKEAQRLFAMRRVSQQLRDARRLETQRKAIELEFDFYRDINRVLGERGAPPWIPGANQIGQFAEAIEEFILGD